MKTSNNFDGTHRTNGSNATNGINVPKSYLNKFASKKIGPNQLLDMMQKADHKGPIQHKIVNATEFERMAREQAEKDGTPMVEKTIFIVKPIYVPISVPAQGAQFSAPTDQSFTSKKKLKLKKKNQQKAIYMERPRPPNYTNSMSTALDEKRPKRATKSKKQYTQATSSRSPSPFSIARATGGGAQFMESLNQNSVEGEMALQSFGNEEAPQEPVREETAKDFK